MEWIFMRGTDCITLFGKSLHFGRDWHTILVAFVTPHWLLYGLLFPMGGAVVTV
jgi:hypothetical protein